MRVLNLTINGRCAGQDALCGAQGLEAKTGGSFRRLEFERMLGGMSEGKRELVRRMMEAVP